MADSISLISEDTPDTPRTPHFLFTNVDNPAASKCSFSIIKERAPASISPERVPINKPSTGVNPIDVSIDLPSLIAVIEPPFPTWQVIIRCDSYDTPKNSQARRDT